MGDIHVLPLAGLDASRLKRLTRDFAAAFEAGDDLGSRVPHVWASARALEGLSDLLEAQIDRLAAVENAGNLGLSGTIAALRRLQVETRKLSRMAANFLSPGWTNPPATRDARGRSVSRITKLEQLPLHDRTT